MDISLDAIRDEYERGQALKKRNLEAGIPEPRIVDYIGLLGKDPKRNPEDAKAWRELRDMVVHGPRLEFTFATKPRLWPWQWSSVTSKRWSCSGGTIGANLPKGGGKTEYIRRMFEAGEATNMLAYMQMPRAEKDYELNQHQSESIDKIFDSIKSVRGRLPARIPVVGLDTALPMGFGNLDARLNGGIPMGSWYNQPMHVPMEIRAKTNRNWPIQATNSELWMKAFAEALDGKIYIDLEGDMDLVGAFERLRRHVDGIVVDMPKKRGGSPQYFAFDYKMGDMQYLYNPTDRLTKLYEKARKKYKHKDAVNYLVKREKHGRKWAAKQLEEIGAAFENKKLEELRAKAKKEADEKWEKQYGDLYDIPKFSPGDYKQFAGRIDRTPKENEE